MILRFLELDLIIKLQMPVRAIQPVYFN